MLNINNSNMSWRNLIPAFIVVASFGPYIFPAHGVRTEHLLIYSLLLFAIPALILQWRTIKWCPQLLGMLILLSGITLWTLAVPVSSDYPIVSFKKYLSSIENYLQPIAIIIVIVVYVRYTSYTAMLHSFQCLCWCLILLLCLNSAIASYSVFFDLTNIMRPFVKSCFGDKSVWELAETIYRHSGIFNQPFESGIMYSIGLLSWSYLNRVRPSYNFVSGLSLSMIIIGGILPVSKVFILGGIPIFIFYWWPFRNFSKYFKPSFITALIIGYFFISFIFMSWEGQDYFKRLFKIDRQTNLVSLYSGGRFGMPVEEVLSPTTVSPTTVSPTTVSPTTVSPSKAHGMIMSNFLYVWNKSPLRGFGFGRTSCFDNAYLEFFYQGGIIAMLGYLILLGIYFLFSLFSFLKGHEEGRLLLAFFILLMGASFGAPVITINRSSAVFWVFTVFLFTMLDMHKKIKQCNYLNENAKI
jgi:hypothetical protein